MLIGPAGIGSDHSHRLILKIITRVLSIPVTTLAVLQFMKTHFWESLHIILGIQTNFIARHHCVTQPCKTWWHWSGIDPLGYPIVSRLNIVKFKDNSILLCISSNFIAGYTTRAWWHLLWHWPFGTAPHCHNCPPFKRPIVRNTDWPYCQIFYNPFSSFCEEHCQMFF